MASPVTPASLTPGTPGVAGPLQNFESGGLPLSSTGLLQNQPNNIATANNIVSNTIGTEATSVEQIAAAQASGIASQGDLGEAGAYTTAATLANQNAELAGISGDIAGFQQMRALQMTMGAQQAGIASAGFGNSGSALNLARSSLQQGYLAHQMIGVNSELQQGGFLEQGQASTAEANAANSASSAALVLQAQQAQAGAISQANATNEATALSGVAPGTPQANLASEAATGVPLSTTDLSANMTQEFGESGALPGNLPAGYQTYNPHTGTTMPAGVYYNPTTGGTINVAQLSAQNIATAPATPTPTPLPTPTPAPAVAPPLPAPAPLLNIPGLTGLA